MELDRRLSYFIGISLLLHLLVAGLVASELFSFEPAEPNAAADTKLVMQEAPLPPELAQQLPDRFIPTLAAQEVSEENPNARNTGEHNTKLASATEARDPNSSLPDMRGAESKMLDYFDTPQFDGKEKSAPSPAAPPSPQQPRQTPQPAPEPPAEQRPDQTPPQDRPQEQPPAEQPPPQAQPSPSTEASEQPPPVYPKEGLEVLPPEKKPAPPKPAEKPVTEPRPPTAASPAATPRPPPMSLRQRRADVEGGGRPSDVPSPEVRATPEGRYKAKMRRAVASRWYMSVQQFMSTLSIGEVSISFYVRANGVIEDVQVTRRIGSNVQLLESISIESLVKAAPFEPFPEEMRRKYGAGYTEEFSFTIE